MTKGSVSNQELASIVNVGFAGIEERMATKDDLAGAGDELKGDITGLDRRLGSVERNVGSLEERTTGVERCLGSLDQLLRDVKDGLGRLNQNLADIHDLLCGSGPVRSPQRRLALPYGDAHTFNS